MMYATERQHLRAIFARGDVPDRLALHSDRRGLRAKIAVGVDLHLDAAIAEDALGHDRDHVDAIDLRGDDKGRRLVIRIGSAAPIAVTNRSGSRTILPSQSPLAWNGTSWPPCDTVRSSTTCGSTRTNWPS